MPEPPRVLSFRLPDGQAALVDRLAERKGIPPAEYMRRAVLRQVRAALLADAASVPDGQKIK